MLTADRHAFVGVLDPAPNDGTNDVIIDFFLFFFLEALNVMMTAGKDAIVGCFELLHVMMTIDEHSVIDGKMFFGLNSAWGSEFCQRYSTNSQRFNSTELCKTSKFTAERVC